MCVLICFKNCLMLHTDYALCNILSLKWPYLDWGCKGKGFEYYQYIYVFFHGIIDECVTPRVTLIFGPIIEVYIMFWYFLCQIHPVYVRQYNF